MTGRQAGGTASGRTRPTRAAASAGDVVTAADGAGGRSSAALTREVFVEAFANPALEALGDAAVLDPPAGHRLAFTTDSFVVHPLRFPGGSIGHLAVHGTVNDLAVSGAVPRWLSAGFVLEEGLPIAVLREGLVPG